MLIKQAGILALGAWPITVAGPHRLLPVSLLSRLLLTDRHLFDIRILFSE
ncbi:hypothetical protein HS3_02254 [Bacillus subtilis]|nr:hypothetical protein BsLM_3322 [Bacillus sp. LM 4-2]RAP08312.1 hypothetical protein HS3_02254 [Bacillus subtilis]